MNELYKNFIIQAHGKPALDRLEMEYAILKTNEVLECRDEKQRENLRKLYGED